MAQIARGRTVFVIAHRLSALRMAYRIITIERGRLIEDGTHDDLIKTGGRARALEKRPHGRAARRRAAACGLAGKNDPLTAFTPPDGAPSDLIQMHRQCLPSQTAEQNVKIAAIDRQVAQKQAERATIKASIEKLEAIIPPPQERVEIRRYLFNKELGSKLIYPTELQGLVGQKREIAVQESRYGEADAAIAALVETRSKTVAQYGRGLFDELAKAEQKAAGLAQDVIKAEQRTGLQKLTAPVDGVVQQLTIHTIGGVVTPAQALMAIVPAETPLEIEAMISNRDIGFVEVGQHVAIKVDTFNFTRYGLLSGKVVTVSHDAITRDAPQERVIEQPQGAETGSSEPKGQELIYAARMSLDHTQMQVEDIFRPAWPSRSRSRPARAGSSAISARRSFATSTIRSENAETHLRLE